MSLAGCAQKRDIHQTLRTSFVATPAQQPQILAAYQPWFGKPSHINVGYSSHDRVVLERQIEQAKSLGITGFVVNWYGPGKDFEDRSYAMLQQLASQHNFYTALMYDEPEDVSRSTDETIRDLEYAYGHYIGPQAEGRSAYLTYEGRPLIFIFPKGGKTDWSKVRAAVNAWNPAPMLIYKDINARAANQFDGFYAWVHPGNDGWSKDGKNWGERYLDSFYRSMTSKYSDKVAVGAAWPGFDDRRASWSRNRHMDSRCGKTFEDSLRFFRRYYNDSRPLPFLMIVTWNDYEEGTAIEKGLQHC
jgi:Glycosyl hydrolase family 71